MATAFLVASANEFEFAVIGTQKGGTTSLTQHMRRRDLCVHGEARLMSSLIATTKTQRGCKVSGLVDPGAAYLFVLLEAQGARLLSALAAHRTRLIFLLREPIQRAFSAYLMRKLDTSKAGLRYESFDSLVRSEASWLGDASARPPPRALITSGKDIKDHVRYGAYGEQLRLLQARGYRLVPPAAARAGGSSLLLVLISERVRAHGPQERARLWRFLGVDQDDVGNESRPIFERRGVYDGHENLSSWAVHTLHAAYRDDRRLVYEALGEIVPEWESWYLERGLGSSLSAAGAAASGAPEPPREPPSPPSPPPSPPPPSTVPLAITILAVAATLTSIAWFVCVFRFDCEFW